MGIKDIFKSALSRDPEFKEMQRQRQMQKMLDDREKDADERELERFYEEERKKMIKKNLEEFRNARRKETWEGKNNQILKQKNIFKNHKNILNQDFDILKGKKLFTAKSKSLKGGDMYFK